MHRLRKSRAISLVSMFCVATLASAQTGSLTPATVGIGRFASVQGGPDIINLGNLDVHLRIPIYTAPGRGLKANYYLTYDSNFWTKAAGAIADGTTILDSGRYGWILPSADNTIGTAVSPETATQCASSPYPKYIDTTTWEYVDPSGGTATSAKVVRYNECNGTYTSAPGSMTRFGEYYIYAGSPEDANWTGGYTATAPDGTSANLASSGGLTDHNGNTLTFNGTTDTVTDTLGRSVTLSNISSSLNSGTPLVLTYVDTNGHSQQVTVTFAPYTVQTHFQLVNTNDYGAHANQYLVNKVSYPDGSFYQFTYEPTPGIAGSVTGRLASVRLPTGGVISYTYTGSNGGMLSDITTAGLTRTTSDGATTYKRISIVLGSTGLPTSSTTQINDPAGTKTVDVDFVATTLSGTMQSYFETRRRTFAGSSDSGQAIDTVTHCYNGVTAPCTTTAVSAYVNSMEVGHTLDNGVSSKVLYTYGSPGNLTSEVDEYDYGATSPQLKTFMSYLPVAVHSPYGQSTSVVLQDGNGNQLSRRDYSYDGCLKPLSGTVPSHVQGINVGNLTTVADWINTTNTTLSTTYCYDQAGQLVSETDPSGNSTSYIYDTTFDAFLTQVTLPPVPSGVALTESATYDTYYGLPSQTTDENSHVTTYAYDAMLRPSTITLPQVQAGTPTINVTRPSYNEVDVQRPMGGSINYQEYHLADGYGRSSRDAKYNGQSTNPYYQSDTCYDSDGRVSFESLPYAQIGWQYGPGKVCSSTGDSTAYDVLDRVVRVTHQDNSYEMAQYSGRATEVTDEQGASRILQHDAFGRLMAVCELSSDTTMPNSGQPQACALDISGTGFLTTYTYDRANHRTTVVQGAQTRTFVEDSLGRVVRIEEPELLVPGIGQGAKTYSYSYSTQSGYGLIVTETKPKANQSSPTVVSSSVTQYDSLGRIVTVTYSNADGTPMKQFSYDKPSTWYESGSQYNLKGLLSEARRPLTSGYTGTIFSYDALSQVTAMFDCEPLGCGTPARDQAISLGYDLVGNLTSESDGGGATASYSLSPAGEVTGITSSVFDATHPASLVSNVKNGPFGPLTFNLGNGLTRVMTYDSSGRSQFKWLCAGGVTTSFCSGGTQLYGIETLWHGPYLTYSIDTVLNTGGNYAYDAFRRLSSFVSNVGQVTSYSWAYDRYGNRWQQNAPQGGLSSPQLVFDSSSNKVVQQGVAYDAAGNLIADGTHTYTYDADGSVIAVDGGATATYIYDAFNQRTHVQNSTGTYEYTYDNAGHRMSTWNVSAGGYTILQGKVYWGDTPIEFRQGNAAHFETQDWEGSERIRTLYNGTVEGTFGALPFGDGKTLSGSDLDNYHFAGLDHDSETDTDHALFRQYQNTWGRWMTPDPFAGSYDWTDPQSFNRYSYTANSPAMYTDASGLFRVGDWNSAYEQDNQSSDTSQIDMHAWSNNLRTCQGSIWCGLGHLFGFGQSGLGPFGPGSRSPFGADGAFGPAVPGAGVARPRMTVSPQGAAFIKGYETRSLVVYDAHRPYGDWTIGWGHQTTKDAAPIGATEAERLFDQDLSRMASRVSADLKVSVTQYQFDALVSLRFNAGANNLTPPVYDLNRTGHATKDDFTKHYITAGGIRMKGLVKRRAAEWRIYSEGIYDATH